MPRRFFGGRLGIKKVNTPNIINLTRASAKQTLETQGLAWTETAESTSDSSLDQKVKSQLVSVNTVLGITSVVGFTYYTYVAPPPSGPPAGPPAGPPQGPPEGPPQGPPQGPPAGPPSSKSVSVSTLVRTPSGLVRAENLSVGDTLLSADLEGFPYTSGEGVTEAALAWTSSNPNLTIVNTTVVEINRRIATKAVIINGDIFSQYHWILVKRNDITQFVRSEEVIENIDYIFDAENNAWEPIDLFEVIEVNHETISINCEPYDMFFTEKMLTHDSFSI
jgi:hypothetical protein